MWRFLAGCATGWMLARSPPTQTEMEKWFKQAMEFLKLKP